MGELRKSPLSAEVLKDNPIIKRQRKTIGIGLLKQEAKMQDKTLVVFDFSSLLNDCELRRVCVVRIAKKLRERLQDRASVDSEYNCHIDFLKYSRYCEETNVDPFTKRGFLNYVGKNGELQKRMNVASKPLPFTYLYSHGDPIGIRENTAAIVRVNITSILKRAEVNVEEWMRDVPAFSSNTQPTRSYSQKEYSSLLRRLHLLFFSISSQLIAAKEQGKELESLEAVFEELDNGQVETLRIKNSKPRCGELNTTSPFNVAIAAAYYLFCHYTNFNTSSVLSVCHPIKESVHKKANRTTNYVSVTAWKGRSNKIVQGVFAETEVGGIDNFEQEGEVSLEIEKRDGLTFIRALTRFSRSFNPHFNDEHAPLFYALTHGGKLAPITTHHLSMFRGILSCYVENRAVHAPYLISQFYKIVDEKTLDTVSISKAERTVRKEVISLIPNNVKKWAIQAAYAALRSLTDIPLKNILMPLSYSSVDDKGYVTISFFYQNGSSGHLAIEERFVSFLQRLEAYSLKYNRIEKSKFHPNDIPTPYLLPLGGMGNGYQWDGLELPVAHYLSKIGIYSGEYLLDISSQRIRATGSYNHIDPLNGGLSVATSLLENSLNTLHDHYIEGNLTQNQVIASQAIETLYEYNHSGSIEIAKQRVKLNRGIEVLEYDEWKALRLPTNPNGLFCDGNPDGTAKSEHRASQKRAKKMVGNKVKLTCFQYDECVNCQSAKLVNDVNNAYKLLSFIELLEDSIDLLPERQHELAARADSLMILAESNLSEEVIEQAESKLINEGRYPLHNQDFIDSMLGSFTHA